MRFKNIEEVLKWTGEFHAHLAEEYQRLARRHDRQRLELLLEYLADHERLLQQSLKRIQEDSSEGLLNTWFDMAPEVPLPGNVHDLSALFRADDVDALVQVALRFHDGMLEVYTMLRNQSRNQHSKELFESLVQLEHHEKLKLVRSAEQLRDM